MKLLMLGAGGTGGYFGGRLAEAGVDIQFLVRPSRATALARDGLVITSPMGDLRIPIRTLTTAESVVDGVLLSCKAYDLDDAMAAIAPAVGPSTLILPLLNGLRHLDALDARFGRERVLGGLCHIGAMLDPTGGIRHLNRLQRLTLGPRFPAQASAANALREVLKRGAFELRYSATILQELWEKFVFLTTYAGITTLMRAPIGAIVATAEGRAITLEMLQECADTAAANGHAPRRESLAEMATSLTEPGSRGTASMLRDMMAQGRTEHEHIVGDMLARARTAAVSAPLLRISLANMQTYEAMRQGTRPAPQAG
jgi:2-dehydropantoate 2-reductase